MDAVYIAVSNVAHYEVAKKALEAGKHVLMEKPFCANREQSAELFALAKRRSCSAWKQHGSVCTCDKTGKRMASADRQDPDGADQLFPVFQQI